MLKIKLEDGMKRVPFVTVLAAVLFPAACTGDPTAPGPTASLRFFNSTTRMTGSVNTVAILPNTATDCFHLNTIPR